MTTIARSASSSVTSVLSTISTTAGVLEDTVAVIGAGINGAAVKVHDWHYEQKMRSASFREELEERLFNESMDRATDLAEAVIKTKTKLEQNPELKQAFDEIMANRAARKAAANAKAAP